MVKRIQVESAAEAYLELLASRGVEYFFGNAGTDFAPLLEAFAKRRAHGHRLPQPVTVPHEVPAVAMAHGYTMVSGRPQVVMLHTTVGTANGVGGLINAYRSRVPILVTAGRTPIAECGLPGARDRHIQWAQESFDQGGMVREWVKWDYELRGAFHLETVVDRAFAIATSEPSGPVYLTLPREVLAQPVESFSCAESSRLSAASLTRPDSAMIERAASALVNAAHPLIIVRSVGRDPLAVAPLVRLAETVGAPVIEEFPTHFNFPQDHALHGGFEAGKRLECADVILVVECDVPWTPAVRKPREDATVIHVGVDPLFSRYPIRGFQTDMALSGSPRLTLRDLADAVQAADIDADQVAARCQPLQVENRTLQRRRRQLGEAAGAQAGIEMLWVSRCIGDLMDESTIVVNEFDLVPGQVCFRRPGSYFSASPAAGLGWGLGAALGAKLAAPQSTVIATLGDGSYIFGAPTAAHFVAQACSLPILIVVFNNRAWNAVKAAVRAYAPNGWAARNGVAMSDLEPAPHYELVCQASGGYGERVDDPASLPGALARALRVVREEQRQALLNVICAKP